MVIPVVLLFSVDMTWSWSWGYRWSLSWSESHIKSGILSESWNDGACWSRAWSRGGLPISSMRPEPAGRPVSRAEALRIVRGTLEQAERERLEAAEVEAARGTQWQL